MAADGKLKTWTYKPASLARFYAWVVNGKLDDMHLAEEMLFDNNSVQ